MKLGEDIPYQLVLLVSISLWIAIVTILYSVFTR